MTCITFQKDALIPNVTSKVIGGVTYIWTGSTWEAKSAPLQLSQVGGELPATRVTAIVQGTTLTLQELLNKSRVTILDFLGADDDDGSLATTNNLTPVDNYVLYLNSIGGGELNLVKKNTGGYFINGDSTVTVTSPITVVAEDGVYLRMITSGGATTSPFSNPLMKYNRELKKIQDNFGFTNYGNPDVRPRPSELRPSLTQTQGVYSVPRVLSGLNFVVVNLAAPDNFEVPITQTGDTVSFSGTGKVIASVKAARIGTETFGLLSSPSAGRFMVGVITANGYAFYSQNSANQEVELEEQATGFDPVILGIQRDILIQQRDNFNNALMSVRIISVDTFSVLCNGLVVGTYKTRSTITGVMFGSKNIDGVISFSQFSEVKTNGTGGSKPLKILCLGDSISDNDVQYSPYRIMSSVLQSQGQQIAELNNLSVSGETIGQQYSRMLDVGSGYDICTVQCGVNDFGVTSFPSFQQTAINICVRAKLLGMTPIIGLPTQYYSRAEASTYGQTGGQDTSHNDTGHTYRALLIRAVASEGGLINLQSLKNTGAMSARWLVNDIEEVEVDSLVVDNIHPTPHMANLLGLGWAESILGVLHRYDDTEFSGVESVPLSWMRNSFGLVRRPEIKGLTISGVVDFEGGSLPEGITFLQLPKHMWPTKTILQPCTALLVSGLPAGIANVYVGPDGKMYAFNIPVDTVSMDLGEIDLGKLAFF